MSHSLISDSPMSPGPKLLREMRRTAGQLVLLASLIALPSLPLCAQSKASLPDDPSRALFSRGGISRLEAGVAATPTGAMVEVSQNGAAPQAGPPANLPAGLPNTSSSQPAVGSDPAPMQGARAQAPGMTQAMGTPGPTLTRIEAEQMAIKNNPRISVTKLLALAQGQIVRESRSANLPTVVTSVTAENAYEASRISAGSLTASRLFSHAGAGGDFTQLLTDFGRTRNLVASSKLQEKAQNATALATAEDIIIATDQAFYTALQAQALLQVALQTVATRSTTQIQIDQLTKNNLKSTLDLSFANVNLSQAKLLQLDAENNVQSSMAQLNEVLGTDKETVYTLVDNSGTLQAPPPDPEQLVQEALQQRPDLQSLSFQHQADVKFAKAQRDQLFPTISTMGTLGSVPIRDARYYTSNWWGAIGVNLNIPVFNGFLYSAQAKEAQYRAQAASEQTRDLHDRIVRDVRTTWLSANTAYQKVSVSEELLNEANLALKLAQTRYDLGLSNIVELSQAQFQQTDAAIGNTNAQYQYRLALATINYQIGVAP
ncbi:MAG: TolC family protein [Acidobacteriaceae bacterium]